MALVHVGFDHGPHLQRLGLNRVAKNTSPSLATYLRSPPPTEIEEAAE